MGKLRSQKERKLQRKLIPLNIFVCVLCLVAALSLFFGPILKVDVGKILSSKETIGFVNDMIDDSINSGGGDDVEGINYAPVVAKIVEQVLGSAKGKLSISAFGAMKVAFASDDKKAEQVLDELLFSKGALVDGLVDGVVDGVMGLFEKEEGKQMIEETVTSVMAQLVLDSIKDTEVAGQITESDIKDLTTTLKKIEQVEDGKVDTVVEELIDKVAVIVPDVADISEEDKQSVIDEVQKIYDDAKDALPEGSSITIENIICVAVSSNVDLSEFNLDELLGGLLGGNSDNEGAVHRFSPVEEEEGSGSEKPNKIVTDYNGLLAEMGLDDEKKETIRTELKDSIKATLEDAVKEYEDYFGYYGYLFYGMLVFIVPWLILFLFSFFHILAKNKRFMMWYVKLFSWIPSIIWLAIKLLPRLLTTLDPGMLEGEEGPLVKAVLSGIGSLTWISGLCYVLLWLVSIFWAFPIKHKIRKERRFCKRTGYVDPDPATESAPSSTDSFSTDSFSSDSSFSSGFNFDSSSDDDFKF